MGVWEVPYTTLYTLWFQQFQFFISNFFLDMFWFVDKNEIIAVQLQTIYNVFKQGPLAKAEKAQ